MLDMAYDLYSISFPTLQEAMAMRGNGKSGGRMTPDWQNPKFTGWRPCIPQEIVKDILSRLPIKSLLRFKCVNKLWNSIISDPDFALSKNDRARVVFFTRHSQYICFYSTDSEGVVQKYLWRRKTNRFKDEDEDDDDDEEDAYEDEDDFVDSEAFIRWDPWRKKETFTQIYPWKRKEAFIRRPWMRNKDQSDDDDDDDYFVDSETFIQRYPWWRMASQFEGDEDEYGYDSYFDFRSVAGSCNGLLLLVFRKSFFLWNPSTGYMRKVLELRRLLDSDYRVRYGLCFDSFTDDYKVVVGLAHLSPDYGGEFVMVASLKEKQWRTVKFRYQVSAIEYGPVVDGFLHWKVNKRQKGYRFYGSFCTSHRIVAFDPKTDEFKELPMPKAKNRDGNVVLGLGVLGGCLCMAHWDNESNFEGNVEVLVMKEYGVKESWTTTFEISNLKIISPFYTSLRPLLLMRNGEILLKMEREILVYNPRKMTYKSVELKKWYGRGDVFVDSLASPTGCEWDKEQHGSLGKQIIWHSDSDSEDTADSYVEDIALGFRRFLSFCSDH